MTGHRDALTLLTASRPDFLDACDEDTRSRILQRATAEPPAPARHHRRIAHPLRWAVAVTAVLAATLAVPHALRADPRPTASAILLTAAYRVNAEPTQTSGRYWHYALAQPGMQTAHWVARAAGDTSWFSITFAGRAPIVRANDRLDTGARTFDVEGRALTFADVAGLPTDPRALKAFLLAPYPADYQRTNPGQLVQRLFGEALDLAAAPVSPAVRSAAFELLSGLPGMVNLGPVHDVLGRPGTAIAITDGQVRHELVIDPSTGAVLATEDISTASGQAVVTWYAALVSAAWTDTLAS